MKKSVIFFLFKFWYPLCINQFLTGNPKPGTLYMYFGNIIETVETSQNMALFIRLNNVSSVVKKPADLDTRFSKFRV